MQAWVPDGLGSVAMTEVAEPTPGPDEVVVAVEAYSVNRGETFLLEDPPPGWRPGKDVTGTVVSAGPGVRLGERVVAHPEHSGWAERVAVPVDRLAVLPESVPSVQAAALPLAGLTALRLVRAIGPLPGRRVLITGASGGVGHYFVELAATGGARVTAISSTTDRGRRLRELGAETVLADIPAASEIRAPYDVVIDSVGGDGFARAWRLLDHHGLFVWMGQASRQPPTIDFFDWTGGANATMRKFLYSETGDSVADDLATLARLVAAGRLHPEIGVAADWGSTPAVLADLVSRRVRANAVLTVSS